MLTHDRTGVKMLRMEKPVYCTRCGTVGRQKFFKRGSVLTGLLLLALFIVPGVIYLIWYLFEGYWGCSACRAREIISIDSPVAKRVLGAQAATAEANENLRVAKENLRVVKKYAEGAELTDAECLAMARFAVKNGCATPQMAQLAGAAEELAAAEAKLAALVAP
jgi:hypothetical protein